jgi:hypothetical protein
MQKPAVPRDSPKRFHSGPKLDAGFWSGCVNVKYRERQSGRDQNESGIS